MEKAFGKELEFENFLKTEETTSNNMNSATNFNTNNMPIASYSDFNFSSSDQKITSESKDEMAKKLENNFNERISILEFTSKVKEKEILDLMFLLHTSNQMLENMKAVHKNIVIKYPVPHSYNSKNSLNSKNKNLNDDLLNKSTLSIMSRRSISTSKTKRNNLGSGPGTEKHKIAAQKVKIDLANTPERKRGIQSIDPILKQAKILEKDLNPNVNAYKSLQKYKEKNKTIKNINSNMRSSSGTDNKVIPNKTFFNKKLKNNNSIASIDNSLRSPKSNKLGINSSINNTSPQKLIEDSIVLNNTKLGKKNNLHNKLNDGKDKQYLIDSGSKNPNNKSNNTNYTKDTNSTIETTNKLNQAYPNRPSFKFEPKKKVFSDSERGFFQLSHNFSGPQLEINNTSGMNNLFVTNIKTSFKSDASNPSLLMEQYNSKLRNTPDNVLSKGSSFLIKNYKYKLKAPNSTQNKLYNFFNDKNNSQIFFKLFEFFSSNNEKIKIKNISYLVRDIYFNYEKNNLEKIIGYKSKQENPLYNISITNEDIFSKNLILSKIQNRYSFNPGFKNLILSLYIIITPYNSSINYINKIVNQTDTDFLIKDIESRVNNDPNIYSKYKEIIDKSKNNKDVYLCFKHLKSHKNFFQQILNFFPDKKDDFGVLLELIKSIKYYLDTGPNLEAIIDIEIMTRKLEIFKSYYNKIQ